MTNFEIEYHNYLAETFAEPTEAEMDAMADYYEALDNYNRLAIFSSKGF